MITKEQRANRLRRHMDLKRSYEVQLDNAKTDAEKKHLEARIAEIVGQMKPVSLPEPKALLSKITKTADDAAKNAEEHIVRPLRQKPLEAPRRLIEMKKVEEDAKPKRQLKKVKTVGNPF